MGITSVTPKAGQLKKLQKADKSAKNEAGNQTPVQKALRLKKPQRRAVSTKTGRQRKTTASTDVQRDRILKVASGLFAEQGYANTTIAQIAQQLGVTKPFVYYYFHDKQELFETLSWQPAVACFTVLDGDENAGLCAAQRVRQGIGDLIRATIANYPCAFFPYKEPQAYSSAYLAATTRLANHFYALLCPLLEQARSEGALHFEDTKITALAACSLPGFLYTWYQPDGRLTQEQLAQVLTDLAMRVVGLREEEGE
ncbi:TetR/AcrR family transcriptional regulator [Lampropedia puyangensis]|uniref:TetR/AcrR family transcriptional regulator n=1 Tax=Lampropedia puyangensis TaxID=1330072 RepID=A0A4S8F564_9BURK|nr:TetR/AcrR family transcriptional regulator [Lampropedia puyangensis]THU02560.1 TetR/AcrR family transcriptional regulator [Lampropedia puyangensis]